MARGVNIHDTRSCGACTFEEPNRGEVLRRIDEAVGWGASLLRLDLESYGSGDGRVQWRGVLEDPAYLADLQAIVAHAAAKPNVYVLISLWTDPTLDENGVPTADTVRVWQRLAAAFKNEPRALFGVANEPQANFDGSRDAQVWAAMNAVVSAIRGVEDAGGTPHHVVTVQGTRQWARVLDYYLTHPIEAAGGGNVAYETHVYDPADTFEQRFVDPSRTLPVIIGEFGPIDSPGVATMTLDDCTRLMDQAEAVGVPYLAWTFHMRCPPNLLQDLSGGSCGIGMALKANEWGQVLRARLSKP
jgi:endoglucanase